MLSLNEVASKLQMVSETALDNWSESLRGAVSDELLEYFKQRIRFILERMHRGFAVELGLARAFAGCDELSSNCLPVSEKDYWLVKDELSKAYKQQIQLLSLQEFDKRTLERQVGFLIDILEESVTANLISALFRQSEQLEAEKRNVRKTLCDVTRLLEKDRQRLAFDLHDGPAQALSSALLQTDILEDLIASAEAKRELASLKSILGQCLQELRSSIYVLKPQCIGKKGLVARVKAYAQQFSSRTGLKVELTIESKETDLPEVYEINVFRVIQEALNNVYKHAQATQVVVSISFNQAALFCSVEDDGMGFNVSARSKRSQGLSGYGLASMRDRVEQFFGTFTIDSRPGRGTCITFSIPI